VDAFGGSAMLRAKFEKKLERFICAKICDAALFVIQFRQARPHHATAGISGTLSFNLSVTDV
jgi:hypothetical protein